MPKARRGNVLTTVVFTDIVGSTKVAEEMGDRRWRELLARHHGLLRDALREHGGREVDTAGDGVFARFDSPASGIRFACAASDAVRELGIEIRAGVHIGECEVFDGKLSGVNVHVGARTMGEATAGQILVTASVRDLVRGAGFGFADHGVHELKGIEGDWQLFEVTSVDDAPRPGPLPDSEARVRRDGIVPPPLVRKRRVRLAVVAVVVAAAVIGASIGLAKTLGGAPAAPLAGCELTTQPPLNDRAFNQAVFDGLTDAATTWGISVRDRVTQNPNSDEWHRHMQDLVKQGCGLIVTVNDFASPGTVAAAKANPSRKFVTTDAEKGFGLPNLVSVVFKPNQAAFLAGYLAAATTKTGKVATFGGIPLPTITGFMDGFAAGVRYYNRRNDANVRLLGWDPETHHGTFVSDDPTDFDAFGDLSAPLRLTTDLSAAGADVIMPVDGPNGETGAGNAAERRHGVLLIGVDTDQHFATPQYEALWLTSVLKVFRRMVYLAMGEVVHGRFHGGVLQGTLGNGGVGLAPFYGLGGRVPAPVRRQLEQIKRGIVNGSISVDPRSYPAH